jgi:hypothetical protein
VGLTALALAAGCGDTTAEERRQVLVRIDALRDATGAPAAERARLVEALRLVKADEPTVLAARDRCVAAYADLVQANALEEEARAAMATGEKVDTLLLAQRLDVATKLLESSRAAMPACDRAVTELRAVRP